MRKARFFLLLVFLLGACGSGENVPEPGAILLQVTNAPGAQVPDELRVWVYDETGALWDGVRVPEQGSLAVQGDQNLGTILVQPGAFQGLLRIHLKGFAAGARVSDGILLVASLSGSRILDIMLDSAESPDIDADGVPDAIDDCPSLPNPWQQGCPPAAPPDAATDAESTGSAADSDAAATDAVDASGMGTDAPTDAWPVGSGQHEDGTSEKPSDDGREDGGSDLGVRRDSAVANPDGEKPGRPGDVGTDSPSLLSDTASPVADVAGLAPDAAVERAGPSPDTPGDVAPTVADASELPDVADDSSGGEPDVREEAGDAADAQGGCGDATACNLHQGAPCNENTECASGACADGVCCTNACLGPCRSCNQPNADGVCQAYAAVTDPEAECTGGTRCNGAGACGTVPPPSRDNGELCTSSGDCRSGFCADGVCCNSACKDPCRTCGSGSCQMVRRADDIPECTGEATCNNKGNCVSD